MEIKEKNKIIGNVKIYSFPSVDYPTFESIKNIDIEKYKVEDSSNMVLDLGLDHMKNLLTGVSSSSLQYVGVGSGSSAVTSSDTDLETAIDSRLLIQTRYSGGTGIAKFDTFFTAGDNNGTWNETIISASSSGANAFARKLLVSTYTKTTSITTLLSWTLTITRT